MTVTFNDKKYSAESFLRFSKEAIKDSRYSKWESEFFNFLIKWNNEEDYFYAHTSGSTGTPKRVKILKEHALNSASKTADYFNFYKEQSAALCLPMSFIAGKMMLIRSIHSDLNLILIEPSSSPLKIITTPIDFIAMTPYQLEKSILHYPEKLKLIKKILLGGAPVSATLMNDIQKLDTEVYLGYGMTETITHVALKRLNGEEAEEFFNAVEGVHFNIDEASRLVINAPHIGVTGLLTQDIAEIRDEHHFIWKGRYDRVINSGGVKIHPEQAEDALSQMIRHPFFIEGVADDSLGQRIILFIEAKEKAYELSELKNILKYIKDIIYIPEFTRSHSGKIDRINTVKSAFSSN